MAGELQALEGSRPRGLLVAQVECAVAQQLESGVGTHIQLLYLDALGGAVECRRQVDGFVQRLERRLERRQVRRGDRRVVDIAAETQGAHIGLVVLPTIGGGERRNLEHTRRQLEIEVLQTGEVATASEPERQLLNPQSRLLAQRQTLHRHVDGVVLQRLQLYMGADILRQQVLHVEVPRRQRLVVLVVAHTRMAHDERVDAQVEWGMGGGILRSERVEHKLDIRGRRGGATVNLQVGTENLYRRDGYLPLHERQQVDLRRQTVGIQQFLLLLVEDEHIVNHQAVEEAQVHTTYLHRRTQLFPHGLRHLTADGTLHRRHVHQHDDGDVERHEHPEQPVEEQSYFSHFATCCLMNIFFLFAA